MNITILTVGSRGDVQPYLALGVGLKQAGYTVKLTTHETFKDLILSYDLDFFPIGGNVKEITQGETGRATIESGNNPFKMLTLLSQALEPIMAESLDNSWQACQDADLVISSGTAFWGDDIAAYLGIPSIFGLLQPVVLTSQIPSPMAPPSWKLGPLFNWLSHQVISRLYWKLFEPPINQWRQARLGEAPRTTCPFLDDRWRTQPKILGYSPSVIPPPTDWTDNCHVTGYWFLDAPTNFAPPRALLDFLADGEPPISIGFGSMASRHAEEITEIALSALKKTGQRGILLTGWSGVSNADLPDHVFKLESIPHDWLFPKMKAIVHHGGAGTTSATVRSGTPGVVVPFFADQPFWADRMAQLGVSPRPVPKQRLSVDRLTEAIRQAIADSALRQRAAQLGTTIRAEDGVAKAVQVVHTTLAEAIATKPAVDKTLGQGSGLSP